MDVRGHNTHVAQKQYVQKSQRFFRYLRTNAKLPILASLLTASSLLMGCEQGSIDTMVVSDTELGLIELDFKSLGNQAANQYNMSSNSVTLPLSCRNDMIINAYEDKRFSLPVKGCGQVTSILPDLASEDHYQRFMVQLDDIEPKHSVMVRHNTTLATRIAELKVGDDVFFFGEYDYTPEGGVIRRTYANPGSRYQHGWIEKEGRRYS